MPNVAKPKHALQHEALPLLSSGEIERGIAPHPLVDNGLRWHVRAFDHHIGEFRNFVFTRLLIVSVLEQIVALEHESRLYDRRWNRFVELELIPHPNLRAPKLSSAITACS
uniref:WYL domain-containing protein n=1 Tax=Halomonas sp. TaxID=1486246 RepID=UPI00260BD442|nr:hypothetical protein [Halomonas sp.]